MVRTILAALAASAPALLANHAFAACDDMLPTQTEAWTEPLSAHELVRMRDVGEPDVVTSARSPYSMSPDGQTLAFVLTRADPDANAICSALVVLPVNGKAAPRLIDRGGALPLSANLYRDLYMRSGFPDTIGPIWSPDGRDVAYRKQVDGVTQIVAAPVGGGQPRQVTHVVTDVEDFAWTSQGDRLVYYIRPNLEATIERIARDGRKGWLLDASVIPMQSWTPQPWGRDLPRQAFVIPRAGGTGKEASPAEQAGIYSPPGIGYDYEAEAVSADGARVWAAAVSTQVLAEKELKVSLPGGRTLTCRVAGCKGRITWTFWDKSSRTVLFVNREGWHNETYTLYRWVPGANRVSVVLRTKDALTGCTRALEGMICGRENATTPKKIVLIDFTSGHSRTLFDPNPEITEQRLGSVQRLRFSNDRGLPSLADLVLPRGYDGKRKLPLVVVQYSSRGFLRGGTGNDYPIFPLADRGFAVLSFDRPPSVAILADGVKDWNEYLKINREDWADRRSVFSSLERGIDQAIATGFIDPKRIGLAGLSDGASTVEFALVNSKRFAAAAMSTCCDDLLGNLVLGGFAWGDYNRAAGYPASVANARAYWQPVSLAINAARIDTPILMQLADREALLGLPAIGALREAGKPVEAFVFPDEFHIKWQPVHRLATYERAIDWFAYWLQGRKDAAPDKQAQYRRWDLLRSGGGQGAASTSP